VNNRTIHTFWAGSCDEQVEKLFDKMERVNSGFKIYRWSDSSIHRLGLDVEDLKFRCQNWAGVSNIVRLHALNQFGGIWLDSDVECLKPLDPLLEHGAFYAFQDESRLCNAVLGATAGHPFLRWQIEREERLKCEDAAEGVYLLTEAPREGVTILPTNYFYPFDFSTPLEERIAHPDSYCLHWWSGSWCKKDLEERDK
jgi:mannosyltransferase OCH1-like enzyme